MNKCKKCKKETNKLLYWGGLCEKCFKEKKGLSEVNKIIEKGLNQEVLK